MTQQVVNHTLTQELFKLEIMFMQNKNLEVMLGMTENGIVADIIREEVASVTFLKTNW